MIDHIQVDRTEFEARAISEICHGLEHPQWIFADVQEHFTGKFLLQKWDQGRGGNCGQDDALYL